MVPLFLLLGAKNVHSCPLEKTVVVTAVVFAVNLMRFWLSVLLFVHLFILVNSFHLWSKWFEWRRVFYSASSLVVQFIFLVMFIVIPVFHPLGSFYLFPSWPSFGRFGNRGLQTGQVFALHRGPVWAGSRPQLLVRLHPVGWYIIRPSISKQVSSVRQVIIVARFGPVFYPQGRFSLVTNPKPGLGLHIRLLTKSWLGLHRFSLVTNPKPGLGFIL